MDIPAPRIGDSWDDMVIGGKGVWVANGGVGVRGIMAEWVVAGGVEETFHCKLGDKSSKHQLE